MALLFLWRNCRMCLPKILSNVFMFAFVFHCRSFSLCWPLTFLTVSQLLWVFMFFFLQNSSLLLLFLSNNVEKDTTLLLFFLSKSPGGHAISFQIKPWVAFWLPYLLIELFYIGMPVVRTVGRSVYGHVITKFSHISTFLYPWCSAERASRSRAPLWWWWRGCHEE